LKKQKAQKKKESTTTTPACQVKRQRPLLRRDKRSGLLVVNLSGKSPTVTSEQIYRLLEEDFP
jgi:hypothetical protein